jgi:membrane protease YdiL (CAAX protease family)
LNRLRGDGGKFGTSKWWLSFAVVFTLVGVIDLSILLTGDGITAAEFATSQPPGLTIIGVISSLIAATVSGFIFASLACSQSQRLNSILSWRLPICWWLVALFLPACWVLLGLGITWYNGGSIESVTGGLPRFTWLWFLLRSILFTLLVVAVGEEAGWRGWLLPELQKRFSPLMSSIFIGVVWGLWHFPLYINGQYSEDPILVLAQTGVCIILATLFTWLYNRTNGSLLLAVVLHTTLNNTSRIIPSSEGMGLSFIILFIAIMVFNRIWKRDNSIIK